MTSSPPPPQREQDRATEPAKPTRTIEEVRILADATRRRLASIASQRSANHSSRHSASSSQHSGGGGGATFVDAAQHFFPSPPVAPPTIASGLSFDPAVVTAWLPLTERERSADSTMVEPPSASFLLPPGGGYVPPDVPPPPPNSTHLAPSAPILSIAKAGNADDARPSGYAVAAPQADGGGAAAGSATPSAGNVIRTGVDRHTAAPLPMRPRAWTSVGGSSPTVAPASHTATPPVADKPPPVGPPSPSAVPTSPLKRARAATTIVAGGGNTNHSSSNHKLPTVAPTSDPILLTSEGPASQTPSPLTAAAASLAVAAAERRQLAAWGDEDRFAIERREADERYDLAMRMLGGLSRAAAGSSLAARQLRDSDAAIRKALGAEARDGAADGDDFLTEGEALRLLQQFADRRARERSAAAAVVNVRRDGSADSDFSLIQGTAKNDCTNCASIRAREASAVALLCAMARRDEAWGDYLTATVEPLRAMVRTLERELHAAQRAAEAADSRSWSSLKDADAQYSSRRDELQREMDQVHRLVSDLRSSWEASDVRRGAAQQAEDATMTASAFMAADEENREGRSPRRRQNGSHGGRLDSEEQSNHDPHPLLSLELDNAALRRALAEATLRADRMAVEAEAAAAHREYARRHAVESARRQAAAEAALTNEVAAAQRLAEVRERPLRRRIAELEVRAADQAAAIASLQTELAVSNAVLIASAPPPLGLQGSSTAPSGDEESSQRRRTPSHNPTRTLILDGGDIPQQRTPTTPLRRTDFGTPNDEHAAARQGLELSRGDVRHSLDDPIAPYVERAHRRAHGPSPLSLAAAAAAFGR